MPMSLSSLQAYKPEEIRVEHIHFAILQEVRDEPNWANSLTLFTDYLAPVILASQKATEDEENEDPNTTNKGKGVPGKKDVAAYSSRFVDFAEDASGKVHNRLTPSDIRLVQYSIAALVRYAPSPEESNVIYLFYLQCDPPVRSDETIDNCLISLIYQYAQVKDNPSLQSKGLDLIKLALHRGIGLPTYNARRSTKNQYRPQTGSILASVSKPILKLHNLQISADGRTLEEARFTPASYGQQPRQQRPTERFGQRQNQQQQQQQRQKNRSPPNRAQNQDENSNEREPEELPQQSKEQPEAVKEQSKEGTLSSKMQPKDEPQQSTEGQSQEQTNAESITSHQQLPQSQPSRAKIGIGAKKGGSARSSGSSTPTSSTYNKVPDDDDQFMYYTRSAKPSFAGVDRDHAPPRSSRYGGELRTIAFVPASTNAALKDSILPPDASSALSENNGETNAPTTKDHQDETADLVEKVEKLRLEPQLDS
ncbi:hypothetical protein BGX28_010477 [Mortierella sp. GBA30]|nr:hypothetical protein BGX28_010477 [Mortierella sp. GBA30]